MRYILGIFICLFLSSATTNAATCAFSVEDLAKISGEWKNKIQDRVLSTLVGKENPSVDKAWLLYSGEIGKSNLNPNEPLNLDLVRFPRVNQIYLITSQYLSDDGMFPAPEVPDNGTEEVEKERLITSYVLSDCTTENAKKTWTFRNVSYETEGFSAGLNSSSVLVELTERSLSFQFHFNGTLCKRGDALTDLKFCVSGGMNPYNFTRN